MIGIPVYKAPHTPLTKTMPDGSVKEILFMLVDRPIALPCLMPIMPGFDIDIPAPRKFETIVLVHPDRWDAFWMAVNQPDVFNHPDVRALLMMATPEKPR
jgi:hypothetical protein